MPAPQDLINESAVDFKVHGDVYTDPRVFELEMRRIFGATWVYVGHESEIPKPGRFKTAYIGLQPVIVSRDSSGKVHVLLNRCRHRGAAVCREPSGEARSFICPYHGWSYDLDGTLQAITQRDGYPADFPQKDLGLGKVARTQIYRGLIFASLNPQVHSLEEHLGSAKELIDLVMDASPAGAISLTTGSLKFSYPGNWKFVLENTVDGYHGNYVHQSFQTITARSTDAAVLRQSRNPRDTSVREQVRFRDLGETRGYPQGHGLLNRPFLEQALPQMKSISGAPEYYDELETKLGERRMLEVLGQNNVYIFPNFYFGSIGMLWTVTPVSVNRTLVEQAPFQLDGAPQLVNERRLRIREQFYGPCGFGTPDDVEAFGACQTGLGATAMPWLDFSRGLNREKADSRGVLHGHSTDELPQRSLYRAWRAAMRAEGFEYNGDYHE
jgi:benzoate/toluate 1,2-dioxygenase subunit alpha